MHIKAEILQGICPHTHKHIIIYIWGTSCKDDEQWPERPYPGHGVSSNQAVIIFTQLSLGAPGKPVYLWDIPQS